MGGEGQGVHTGGAGAIRGVEVEEEVQEVVAGEIQGVVEEVAEGTHGVVDEVVPWQWAELQQDQEQDELGEKFGVGGGGEELMQGILIMRAVTTRSRGVLVKLSRQSVNSCKN